MPYEPYRRLPKGWALQRFDQEPQYTEVNPQEDALLVCKVFNKKGSCSWQKDNKPVGIYARKYEWAGNQESGDCSLWVRSATLDFDDGEWECQVTASDFTTQDALTSMPVRLVVRVAPQRPRIEYNTSQVLPGHNVTAKNGERATLKCVSRYGNPPARLKWFLGERELTAGTNQSNTTELDNPRTWVAVSILEVTLTKAHHNQNIRCVALHESYDTKSQVIEVRLNIRYAPQVMLVGVPSQDLEEGRDDAVLRCSADANPPATIVWRRAGRSDIASLEESLAFRPVTRRDSGTYTCQAKNIVGSSELLSVQLDVKYPPHITSVGPDRLITAPLFSHTIFNCTGDGNPKPTFQWLQKVPIPAPEGTVLLRSNDATLPITNVTYDYQGEYVCKATNVIGGKERAVQSEPISVQVVGAPQVLRQTGGPEVAVSKGSDALLQMVVCADPRPRRVSWEWGSLKLEAGKDQGKYKADELHQDEREDCYQARLHVRQVDTEDERNYYLAVENDRGEDRHAIHLAVTEPLPMATLVSVAAGGLLACLLVLCIVIYAVRKEKCCFSRKSRRGDFQPTDLESEKSDVDSSIGRRGLSLAGAIPAEAMYNSSRPHIITSSPEAMKRQQNVGYNRDNVYADLQLPAISNNGSTMTKTKTKSSKVIRNQQVSDSFYNSPQRTNVYYMTGNFQPNSFERAEI